MLPSYREGTPRSTLEALSTGRPIITTDVPGCRETVINNKNGLIVPVKNSVALANAMINLLIEKDDKDIIAIRNMMMLSLGFDHRLIDGAGGAKFLLKIKNHLENIDFESLL